MPACIQARHDIRVLQTGHGTCLSEKAVRHPRVHIGRIRRHFNRDAPSEMGVLRQIDDSHPAATDRLEEPVGTHDDFVLPTRLNQLALVSGEQIVVDQPFDEFLRRRRFATERLT